MEERSIDRVDNDGVGGMFDNSPLQSAMTEFFRTSTPGPLDGAATTPAPFTLTDNTLRNSTAPLHFGHRELIAVAEPSSAANINYGSRMERERERIHNLGLDGFSILQIHRGGVSSRMCERAPLSLNPVITSSLATFMRRISRTRRVSDVRGLSRHPAEIAYAREREKEHIHLSWSDGAVGNKFLLVVTRGFVLSM